MIRTIDIDINAADPSQPLAPFKAYVTSPSALRIRNVPRRIGTWEITSVQFTVNYPDNTSRSAVCKLVAGVWVGTVVGSTSTGTSTNGFAVTASGVDENGYAVTGYILGKGDVLILATDGTVTVGETTYYVHILDSVPSAPKKGDICIIDNTWKIYTGSEWKALGGGTGDVCHSDFTSVSTIADRYTLADIKGKVNEVLNILKGSTLALIAAISAPLAALSAPLAALSAPLALATLLVWPTGHCAGGVESQSARLDALANDALVVTNVTGTSGLTTNDVCNIVTNDVGGAEWVTNITATYRGKYVILREVSWSDSAAQWKMRVAIPAAGDETWDACVSPNNTNPNATQLESATYLGLITTRGTHNALGLAYERDIRPTISNTVTAAYVESLGISAGLTTNEVNALIASPAVTNAGAVAAAKAYADAAFLTFEEFEDDFSFTTLKTYLANSGFNVKDTSLGWRGYTAYAFVESEQTVLRQNLPDYLDSLAWRTTGNRSLASYGITNTIPADTSATVSALATTSATHTVQIAGWENYWTGDKVRLSVTNYYGNTSGELPRLRIEEFDHSTTTVVDNVQIVSNFYKVVWDEESRHTNYQAKVDAKVETISNTVMTAAWQQTYLQLANKAPRAWQGVTSAGEAAPENTVWMTAPNTMFAGGTEYAHVAVGEGTICVLVDKGAPVYTEGEEGTFHFYDESRQYYFGFDIRDSYTIGCRPDGISVNAAQHLVMLTYDLVSSDNPTVLHSTNLVDWTEQAVTWEQNPPTGTKVCSIDVGSDPKGFYKSQLSYAGGAKFVANMAADLAGGIMATNISGQTSATQLPIYPVITSTGVVWQVNWGN